MQGNINSRCISDFFGNFEKYSIKNKNNYIVDQAGRKLFELMNFRILLEKPKSENLPEYYKYDENELTEYYNNTFGTENGLFMREFNEHDQLKK